MEFVFLLVSLLLPIVAFVLIRKSRPVQRWPPGPKPLPIIGNMLHVSPLPFRSFADMAKKYGPLIRLKLGEVETIVVSSPELAKEILKDNEPIYSSRPDSMAMQILWYNYLDIAFSPYGDYWKQMRKICVMDLLSPKNVRSFGTFRKDEVSKMINEFRLSAGNGKPVNLTQKIFGAMSSVSARTVFGKLVSDKDALIKIANQGIRMAGGFLIADFFPSSKIVNALSPGTRKLRMMQHNMDAILDDLIDQHRAKLKTMPKGTGNSEFGTEDIVDTLLRLQETGDLQFPLGNDNIKAVIFDIFAAGTDTTSTAMDWAMAELLQNPRVMAKVQAELRSVHDDTSIAVMDENDQRLKYLNLVIKETLRMHPSVPIVPRRSRENRVVDGYMIPANTRIMVNSWGMHRDAKYWKNPEVFEPERFEESPKEFLGGDFEYLPFGAGRRMCPGITFSMTGAQLVLSQLLYHFDWKLPEGVKPESLDMMEAPGLTTSRRDSVYAIPIPYKRKN